MRPAKIPAEVVYAKVWDSLCKRMDPATHRVHPSWLAMMREIGVCRQRIATTINMMKAQGKLKVVTVPKPGPTGKEVDYYYEVCKSPK